MIGGNEHFINEQLDSEGSTKNPKYGGYGEAQLHGSGLLAAVSLLITVRERDTVAGKLALCRCTSRANATLQLVHCAGLLMP